MTVAGSGASRVAIVLLSTLGCAVKPGRRYGHRSDWRELLLEGCHPDMLPSTCNASKFANRDARLPPLSPFAKRYLDLVELTATGSLNDETGECHPESFWLPKRAKKGGNCFITSSERFVPMRRLVGDDWPTVGFTMVGHAGLHNVRVALETVYAGNVPGDFAEFGVWRGGTALYAKACVDALDHAAGFQGTTRNIFLFDAFGEISGYHEATAYLQTDEDEVKHMFDKYALLDDHVHFVKGMFKDTLPVFKKQRPNTQFAVLRVDGNFYETYQDVLYHFYESVPVGGVVILDDIGSVTRRFRPGTVRDFWEQFSRDNDIPEKFLQVDRNRAFFVKTKKVKIDWSFYEKHAVNNAKYKSLGGEKAKKATAA